MDSLISLDVPSHPGRNHWLQAKAWLKSEHEAEGRGFWRNVEVLEESFRRRQLAVATLHGECVAILAWSRHGAIGCIDVLTVKADLRGTGIGRRLAECCMQRMARTGAVAVTLQVMPEASEGFWRRLGFDFSTFVKEDYEKGQLWMERLLIEPRSPVQGGDGDFEIIVWQGRSWEVTSHTLSSTWSLGKRPDRISPVIVTPCSPDWRVDVVGPGIHYSGPAKRLSSSRSPVDSGFLVLSGLVLPDLKE